MNSNVDYKSARTSAVWDIVVGILIAVVIIVLFSEIGKALSDCGNGQGRVRFADGSRLASTPAAARNHADWAAMTSKGHKMIHDQMHNVPGAEIGQRVARGYSYSFARPSADGPAPGSAPAGENFDRLVKLAAHEQHGKQLYPSAFVSQ